MNTRVLLRVGAVAAVVGVLLQVVATVTEASISSVPAEAMREIADSGFFASNRVIDALGVMLTLVALLIVGRTFRGSPGAAWASIGQVMLAVALACGLTAIALGIAVYEVASAGVAAEAAQQAGYVAVVDGLGYAVGAVFFAAFLTVGLYLGTLAAAIFEGNVYPRWLGWTSAAGGALLVIGASGSVVIADEVFLFALLGFLLWMIIVFTLGIKLWQRASAMSVDVAATSPTEPAATASA